MSEDLCEFCGRDPYEWVNNGVGMERVAITCCDEGIQAFYASRDSRATVNKAGTNDRSTALDPDNADSATAQDGAK